MKRLRSTRATSKLHSADSNATASLANLELEPLVSEGKRSRSNSPVASVDITEEVTGICFFCFALLNSRKTDIQKLKAALAEPFGLSQELVETINSDSVCINCQICLESYCSIFIEIQDLQNKLKEIDAGIESNLKLEADADVIEKANANGQLDALLSFRQGTFRLRYAQTEKQSTVDQGLKNQVQYADTPVNLTDHGEGVQHYNQNETSIASVQSFASIDDHPDCLDFSDNETQGNGDTANVETSSGEPSSGVLTIRNRSIICNYLDPLTKECTLKFGSIAKLEAHLKSHTLRVKMELPSLQSGRQKQVARRKIKCTFSSCSGKMIARYKYVTHVRKSHGYFTCELKSQAASSKKCFEVFQTEELLQNHQTTCHKLQNLVDRDHFLRKQDVVNPQKLVGSKDEFQRITCEVCARKPSLFRSLFPGHMSRHGYFTCLERISDDQLCCSTFDEAALLETHFELAHDANVRQDKEMQFAAPLRKGNGWSSCPACGRAKLKDSKQFRDHLTKHGFFPCGEDFKDGFCKRFFRTQDLLELHKPSCKFVNPQMEYNGLRMECRFCKIFFYHNREAWESHIKSHNAHVCNWVDPQTQKHCNRVEISEQLIRIHRTKKHGADPNCLPTPELAVTEISASEEVQSASTLTPLLCTFCEESCSSFAYWKSHIEGHGVFVCEVLDPVTQKQCNEVLISEGKLALHCRNVHGQANAAVAPYVCPECKYCAKTQSILENHMKVHNGPRSEMCELCGKSCSSLQALQRHKVNAHGEKATFCCPHCNKGFIRSYEMKEHVRFMHEGATVSCAICNVTFSSKAKLNMHRTTVHGEKVTCPDCGKEYPNRSRLYSHRRVSHAGRNHACLHCGWTFAMKGALVRHINSVHENVRRFVCDICGAAMKSANQLRDHSLKHDQGTYRGSFAPRTRKLKTPPPLDLQNVSKHESYSERNQETVKCKDDDTGTDIL